MPSQRHEVLLELFRARTSLAPELLRLVFQLPIPAEAKAEPTEGNLTQLVPTELNADLVLLLGRRPELVVVVEVQLHRDPDKAFRWPLYSAALRNRHRCPVVVLVVAPKANVARWARRPVDLGPRHHFEPLVLGPEQVPPIEREEEAARSPELAVLSAIAHALDPERGPKVAWAALQAIDDLDDNHRTIYYDLIQSSLGGDIRKELTRMAFGDNYQYQSKVVRQIIADAKKQGLLEGLQEGRQAGRQEGRKEGRQEGRQEGLAETLLRIFQRRGWAVSVERERQVRVASEEELGNWLDRAIDASALEQVFSPH